MTEKEIKKYSLKGLKRKKIKTKICWFSEYRLKRHGLKDGKQRIIRMDNNNNYFSPFILKEQSSCMAAILKEEEMLIRIITYLHSDMGNCDIKIDRNDQMCEAIKNEDIVENENLALSNYYSENNIESNRWLFSFFTEHTKLMNEKLKTVQAGYICDNVSNLKFVSHVDDLIIKREIDITCYRCQQLFEIMISRISAYWNGVLKSDKNSESIPPIFNTTDLINTFNYKINMIKEKYEVS